MPQYRMITNRGVDRKTGRLTKDKDALTFWSADRGAVDRLGSWTSVPRERFYDEIRIATRSFPDVPRDSHENQKHLALFVHGYNNDWADAARRYASLSGRLFSGSQGLGMVVLFSWPSDGMTTNYLPDRADAERSAGDLLEILSDLYPTFR